MIFILLVVVGIGVLGTEPLFGGLILVAAVYAGRYLPDTTDATVVVICWVALIGGLLMLAESMSLLP